jgi:hypothetical protein
MVMVNLLSIRATAPVMETLTTEEHAKDVLSEAEVGDAEESEDDGLMELSVQPDSRTKISKRGK